MRGVMQLSPPQAQIPESDLWKVASHPDIPFVLKKNDEIVESAFGFLKLLHLRGMSNKTIRAYAFDLLSFYRFLEKENLTLDILSHQHFTGFILSQRKEKAAPRTINRRLVVARSFLNSWSEGWGDKLFGKTCASFYKGVRNKALLGKSRLKNGGRKSFSVQVPSVLITPLSPTEIKKFLCGLRKYRDHAILCLMVLCGLRSCEVLALKIEDIDFIDDQLRISGKGNKPRILPLSAAVRKALSLYLDFERPECLHSQCFVALKGNHRGEPLTAEGLRKLFRNRRKKSILKANPHLFRHTFCTHMIRQGVSLPVVQKLMGHADIEVTMGYVHMSFDDVSEEYHRAITALTETMKTENSENS